MKLPEPRDGLGACISVHMLGTDVLIVVFHAQGLASCVRRDTCAYRGVYSNLSLGVNVQFPNVVGAYAVVNCRPAITDVGSEVLGVYAVRAEFWVTSYALYTCTLMLPEDTYTAG